MDICRNLQHKSNRSEAVTALPTILRPGGLEYMNILIMVKPAVQARKKTPTIMIIIF